ncbi:hypothetical protein BXU08_19390 [Sphingomonas sp. LM7]|nr:hypothetical protein BXU08_19390 [Sphingomonas sp. LM7]
MLAGGLAVGAAAALVGVRELLASSPETGSQLTPEQFGAKGDGQTNDTAAFGALSAAINAAGGGSIALRKGAVYVVGGQSQPDDPKPSGYTFLPVDVLKLRGCRGAVVLQGNGATLRAMPGYRFGTFGRDGRPTRNKLPFYGPEAAAAYRAMIDVEGCSGTVLIENLTLDGNIGRARLGGGWGDAGTQLPGCGLVFRNNSGRWRVVNVRAFQHPLDGIMVDDPGTPQTPASGSGTTGCDFYENGRQAMSIVGGIGHYFEDTKFRRTRRNTAVVSPPGAGVDLEAEGGKLVRGTRFLRCEMTDNAGPALLHGGGKVSDITLTECRLVGTTTWSYYSSGAKDVRFVRTVLVGAVTNLQGGPQGELFDHCLLTNDPAEAPRGTTPYSPSGFIIPDGVKGVRIIGGEIRQAAAAGGANANYDQMLLDGVTIRATRGEIALYGRFQGACRFVEQGGRILALPGGAAGTRDAGHATAAWTLTRNGKTTQYPATCTRCPPAKG